jgi:FkbM family methyltransferase
MPYARLEARIPVEIEFPEAMRHAVAYVLDGEYESGHDGSGLTILDIGANVGSFALWASRRWPGSVVHSYEPNPETFEILKRNTAGMDDIHCVNAAVFPLAGNQRAGLFARYAGDGEAALVAYAGETFRVDLVWATHQVDVIAPTALPRANVVKIDIEGGEAAVLEALDLAHASLVLAEFQNGRCRRQMQDKLARSGFVVVRDEAFPWDPILNYRDYRQDLAGDVYGHLFYERLGQTRLFRRQSGQPAGARSGHD